MHYLIIFFALIFLVSCASRLEVKYDDQGRVKEIISRGAQDSSIKQDDIEVKMNSKAEPLKDIIKPCILCSRVIVNVGVKEVIMPQSSLLPKDLFEGESPDT